MVVKSSDITSRMKNQSTQVYVGELDSWLNAISSNFAKENEIYQLIWVNNQLIERKTTNSQWKQEETYKKGDKRRFWKYSWAIKYEWKQVTIRNKSEEEFQSCNIILLLYLLSYFVNFFFIVSKVS